MVNVEVQVRNPEVGEEKTVGVNVDVNEIINKVRDFVDSIKETSLGGQRLAVDVEGFNFSVGSVGGKFGLKLGVDLSFTPKSPVKELGP